MGPDGAGHFVKMVHNGIEYGDMQLICEAYQIMRGLLGLQPEAMQQVFARWNDGRLKSYLIEITAAILGHKEKDGTPTVDLILDTAGQKGTGKWTVNAALDLGIPLSLISESVFARCISAQKEMRKEAAAILPGPDSHFSGNRDEVLGQPRTGTVLRQDNLLCPGFCPPASCLSGLPVEPRFCRHCPHLAGRLHHPFGFSRPHRRRLHR